MWTKRVALWAAVALGLSACASGGLTTREKGTLGGAALGAGTGAIIGSATGHAGTGALIGAGLGAVTGAVVGDALQAREQPRYEAPPPPPPAPQTQAAPPPPSQASVTAPGQYTGDPTRGQLINGTRWKVQIYLDADPNRLDTAPAITLNPQETAPANMDVGQHRVIARAFVDTQFGSRLVGRYDRTMSIDPRSTGWSIRFGEGDFK